jgi:hypothetical protein
VPTKKEKQPLSVTHPELAKQADGWDPASVTPGSGKKLLWRCSLDHKFEASVSHRTNMGSGCPFCSGKKTLAGFNDLFTTHPDVAHQAVGWDPGLITAGSGKKLSWRCSEGHIYESTVANRTTLNRGTGCPICANKVVIRGLNDIASKFPEIAGEADGWDPTLVTPGSSKRLAWKCRVGHQYVTTPAARTGDRKSGCPACSNRILISGFNDLATRFPEIASEADGWDPSKISAGAHNKLSWRCINGHTYLASIVNRTSHKSGCPICSGRNLLTGFNDLATKFPDIASEAFGWDPQQISAGTHHKRLWKCPLGHIYEASISSRTSKVSRGCSICAGKQIQIGFNDLASQFPEIALEADGWDPMTITSGIDTKMKWKCPQGHLYSASVGSRTNLGTGCPVCANLVLLKGFNDLKTKNPLIAQEAFDCDPSEILAGSKEKIKWKCPNGHIYSASVSKRTTSKSPTGCPNCGKYGFDSTKKGHLYLLQNDGLQMLQVGITNDPERRLKEHRKTGWELLEIRGPMDGDLIQQWETAILRMLKAHGADLSNAKIAGKFDGYSEAWSKSTFEVKSVKELMLLTEEFEEK